MLIGLISDTHGYLGGDALDALAGCDQIVHAGDIGSGVLERLASLAPVVAVRGNNDRREPEALLPEAVTLDAGDVRLAVVHQLKDAPEDGWDVLVFGHCHKRHAERDGERLLINPGAAGKVGFHQRRSVARLDTSKGLAWEFIDLGPRSGR